MTRNTVDLGIDLGTTNSCAAVFGDNGPEVVRVGVHGLEYIPSVVLMRGGIKRVGEKAYNALNDPDRWDSVQCEFKRMMGSQEPFTFGSSGETRTAEQLSTDVLMELSGAVEQRLGERLRSAVVTVPAWFESVQREATLRAASAAGFDEVLLLQEPIAAALGYGFDARNADSEMWLVFDLGGGTLDVAVVESANGELRVIDHHGDNFRGGKDLDWMILEQFVQARLADKHRIPPFSKSEGFWRVLKPQAESAKIELSSKDRAWIDPNQNVRSLDGEPISTVVELSRHEYEAMIGDWIDEAIGFAPSLLRRCGVDGSSIKRALLVGGPTHTPLLRRRIVERLGIPTEVRAMDPMTIVARGAAVFAGSKQSARTAAPGRQLQGLKVDLRYKPVYSDLDPVVSGRFEEDCGVAFVELIRDDGAWSSGRLPIADSAFLTRVLLEAGKRNSFSVRAYDTQGSSLAVVPATFAITHGLESAPATLPMSYLLSVKESGVERDKTVMDVVIARGTPLPYTGKMIEYRTATAVKAGSDEDVLKIPLVEGEYERLDLNRKVGQLEITGTQIPRNLPENSEIVITVKVDENGIPTVSAYIPLLDQSFSQVLGDKFMAVVDLTSLGDQVREERDRARTLIQELNDAETETDDGLKYEAGKALRQLEQLDSTIQTGQASTPEELQKIDRERKDAAEKVERLATDLELPRACTEFEERLEWAQDVIDTHGDPADDEALAALVAEGRQAMAEHNLVRVQDRKNDIAGRAWQVLFRIDGFWIGVFQDMSADPGRFTNQVRAQALLAQGREALSRQDMDALKDAVWELWSLYPETAKRESSQRFATGLRRA